MATKTTTLYVKKGRRYVPVQGSQVDHDGELLLMCGVRYALGSSTYVPGWHCLSCKSLKTWTTSQVGMWPDGAKRSHYDAPLELRRIALPGYCRRRTLHGLLAPLGTGRPVQAIMDSPDRQRKSGRVRVAHCGSVAGLISISTKPCAIACDAWQDCNARAKIQG